VRSHVKHACRFTAVSTSVLIILSCKSPIAGFDNPVSSGQESIELFHVERSSAVDGHCAAYLSAGATKSRLQLRST
jgi:hypothetical protein